MPHDPNFDKETPMWSKIAAALIVFGVPILFLAWCFGGPNEKSENDLAFDAYFISQEFVKTKLKAPSTADFASYSDSYISKNKPGEYTIDSYVDAENSFGANIRNTYKCAVSYNELDENWDCIYLFINNQPQ